MNWSTRRNYPHTLFPPTDCRMIVEKRRSTYANQNNNSSCRLLKPLCFPLIDRSGLFGLEEPQEPQEIVLPVVEARVGSLLVTPPRFSWQNQVQMHSCDLFPTEVGLELINPCTILGDYVKNPKPLEHLTDSQSSLGGCSWFFPWTFCFL